jgi:hypothetical protein
MRVLNFTPEQLLERHGQLLAQARMTRAELEEYAEAGLLEGEAAWLWEELRGVETLLGGAMRGDG